MKPTISQNDFYTQQAKKENYPSRSIYKLKEIDAKYPVLKEGDMVLDLGCSPGSWLLYIAQRIGFQGKVVGIDMADIKIPLSKNTLFLKKDILDADLFSLKELKEKYDVVVSDAAPKTSGIKFVDAEKSFFLCQRAFKIARTVLKEKGNFVCKIFEGEESHKFLKDIKEHFNFVKKFKPQAVRKGSKEFYVVAKDYHPKR